MSQLTDIAYLYGELKIGQGSQPEVIASVNKFIAKYEKRYLILLLGDDLYNQFVSGLLVGPVDQKWTDLKNAIVDTVDKVSPISNYVYFYFQRNEVTQTVGAGEATPDLMNGITASKLDKTRRAWNEMVSLNRVFLHWMQMHAVDYGFVDPLCHYYPLNERHLFEKRRALYQVINALNF